MKRIFTIITTFAVATSLSARNGNAPSVTPHQNHTPVSKLAPDEYMANTMIFNMLPEFRSVCSNEHINIPELNDFFTMIGAVQVKKIYPNEKQPETKFNKYGQKMVDITLIYQVTFTSALDLDKAIGKMFNLGYCEYVEPHYIPKCTLVPNDPQATQAQSYYLYTVHAAGSTQSGWDISTGSTSVIIGIVDTGTELTHSDLVNQFAHNAADPVNGVDDDLDGYVDNYTGWDVALNDNDATWQGNAHGVAVCGDADAQVNNNNKVAGPGFNCKIMPVKIADATGALTAGYEGITYAADHGCGVINCSWGGTGGGSYGQSIITYATVNKDALVVCAAGNDGLDEAFYPAAYDYVLSVAATQNGDSRASFSNWNYTVDVDAPGVNILSTWTSNSTVANSGTSMASPITSGCAAIVRSFYPGYNAMQTGERLKQTADNIYSVAGNTGPTYADKLGTGRINLYRALTDPTTTPSVIYSNINFDDHNDEAFVANDTVRITGLFTNYLATTTNLVATLSVVTGGTYVSVLDGSTTVGALATMGTATHVPDPFQVKILPTAPINQQIDFKLTMTDGSYSANQYFSLIVNVDYINITVNDVWTTNTSKGLIGYNGPNQVQGLGFDYHSIPTGTLMYESSFMVGKSSSAVDDMVRGATPGQTDADFSSTSNVRLVAVPVSDFDTDGKFSDAVSPAPLPCTVHHTTYAWGTFPHQKYVIFQYIVKNTGATSMSGVYVGVFSDWDIDASTYALDKINEDLALRMGYAYCTNPGGYYCGIKLLTTSAPFVHYGIDNVTGGGGGVNIYDGYSTAEKYTTLSTGRATAGGAGTGNDVCDVVSAGPYTIAAGDSVKVAFALIVGDNLADLQSGAVDAQTMYDGIPLSSVEVDQTGSSLLNLFPNPTSGQTEIHYSVATAGSTELRLMDASGRLVREIASGTKQPGEYIERFDAASLTDGIYFIQFISDGNVSTRKVVIAH
ncbi:MAG: S8 family peptidase [Bacteroidetes bacterium]|nr:S8 family peptidase [Bacteroidota bacterium]